VVKIKKPLSTMKHFITFFFSITTQFVFGQTLTVINQDYELAKKECVKQNKLLLIDFYTTWCGPCKKLDKLIFQDAAVSTEIAKQFVLLKYDAEKDSAHQLTAKYHIAMFPSAVVLNQNQFVINRMYGTGAGDDMVINYKAFLQKAINNNASDNYVKGISNEVKLGFPKFYLDNVNRVKNKSIKTDLENFWSSTNNFLDEIPFTVLSYYTGGSEAANSYFFSNKKKFEDLYGDIDVKFIVAMLIHKKFDETLKTKNRILFTSATNLTKESYDKKTADNIVAIWEERMFISEDKWGDAIKKFILRKREKDFSDDDINSFCWTAYEKCKDKMILKKCVKWMKEICTNKQEYQYLDTYARLLYKAGNKNLGMSEMQKGISIGIANKEDVKDSEAWLKNIGKIL
jgi:thiol-disulfide isomerase/thioredoxin